MKITLLRSPGHTLREQLGDTNRTVADHVMLVMFISLVILELAFLQNHFTGWQHPTFVVSVYLTLKVVFIAVVVIKLWKAGGRLDRLKAGFDAESADGSTSPFPKAHGCITTFPLTASISTTWWLPSPACSRR